ncbi:uncharacterized protein L969DRAFT_96730 [Mixia osmundae IAM 14324]|uniref:ER membrane protein complex subunit 7 beta-sandwich domain-containing protein n=1 Tax=Mixia osmundae (strain CBS 9802 / IAM 14324 / JCM 22182 / KY 12970) TaxID=764103 RepID=G7DZI7_MIXOS|nr:uncharacterized protein L969DRAFT_96730 [Mixia osmundae IAM 14324]KEI37169.1 hypothetical protein L969DRAFT_96730 [Mixia osmundae IAM 14324]GAA95997.1 hypothetical protein E5Q_02657 [Mixia osmundae IAM 14324]
MQRILSSLCCLCLLASTSALTLSGTIVSGALFNSSHALSYDTAVLLDYGAAGSTLIRRDGSFSLQDVAPGRYIISVDSLDFTFPEYTVEFDAQASAPTVKHHTLTHVLPSSSPSLGHPIQFQAQSRPQYVAIKQGFNIINLIKGNPMMLIMGASVLMVLGLPKLMEMLDPEALAAVQADQAKMHGHLAAAQNMDFAGGLSKLLSGGDEAAEQTQTRASANAASRGNARSVSSNNARKRR